MVKYLKFKCLSSVNGIRTSIDAAGLYGKVFFMSSARSISSWGHSHTHSLTLGSFDVAESVDLVCGAYDSHQSCTFGLGELSIDRVGIGTKHRTASL
jgi:hypothetical protein